VLVEHTTRVRERIERGEPPVSDADAGRDLPIAV
jgi:hypothetical protein